MNYTMKKQLKTNINLGQMLRKNSFDKLNAQISNNIYQYFIQRFQKYDFKWSIDDVEPPDCIFHDCLDLYDSLGDIVPAVLMLYEKMYVKDMKFYIKIYYVARETLLNKKICNIIV